MPACESRIAINKLAAASSAEMMHFLEINTVFSFKSTWPNNGYIRQHDGGQAVARRGNRIYYGRWPAPVPFAKKLPQFMNLEV
jgi:hypothetical protein